MYFHVQQHQQEQPRSSLLFTFILLTHTRRVIKLPNYSSCRLQKTNNYSTNTKSLAWSGSNRSQLHYVYRIQLRFQDQKLTEGSTVSAPGGVKAAKGGRWAVIGKCSRAGSPRHRRPSPHALCRMILHEITGC